MYLKFLIAICFVTSIQFVVFASLAIPIFAQEQPCPAGSVSSYNDLTDITTCSVTNVISRDACISALGTRAFYNTATGSCTLTLNSTNQTSSTGSCGGGGNDDPLCACRIAGSACCNLTGTELCGQTAAGEVLLCRNHVCTLADEDDLPEIIIPSSSSSTSGSGNTDDPTVNGFEACRRYETDEKNMASCIRCYVPQTGKAPGIYTAIGCIDPTPKGILTGLIRISLGIMSGVALVQLILVGLMYQSGDEAKIADARGKLFATLGGVALMIFSLLILDFIGVNVLNVLPQDAIIKST